MAKKLPRRKAQLTSHSQFNEFTQENMPGEEKKKKREDKKLPRKKKFKITGQFQ